MFNAQYNNTKNLHLPFVSFTIMFYRIPLTKHPLHHDAIMCSSTGISFTNITGTFYVATDKWLKTSS